MKKKILLVSFSDNADHQDTMKLWKMKASKMFIC